MRAREVVAPRREQLATLERWLDRGRRHARGQRIGCAVTSGGVIVATLLLALGHYYVMAIVGAVALVAYGVASALDPELADDRRVRLVRALLDALPIDDAAPVTLALELADCEIDRPVDKRPAGSGKLRARYEQRWLVLGFLAKGGVRVRLELVVNATIVHDGIAIASRDEHEVARLRFEIDGSEISVREASEPSGWTRDGAGFRVAGLASAAQVVELVLGELSPRLEAVRAS